MDRRPSGSSTWFQEYARVQDSGRVEFVFDRGQHSHPQLADFRIKPWPVRGADCVVMSDGPAGGNDGVGDIPLRPVPLGNRILRLFAEHGEIQRSDGAIDVRDMT